MSDELEGEDAKDGHHGCEVPNIERSRSVRVLSTVDGSMVPYQLLSPKGIQSMFLSSTGYRVLLLQGLEDV